MGIKRQKFSWSLMARHLYSRQLAYKPQTGSLATTSSLDRTSTSSNMQATALCCTSMQGQTVVKVHGNLNKGASGSMKLN